jgi:Xaa-Pro aminopeptidase
MTKTNFCQSPVRRKGEIMRLDQHLYALRRETFMKRMGGGVAIFPNAPISIRSNDVEYRYRQDNDLYYLTGFPEPESVCLLAPDHPSERFVLFVRPRDKDKEVWTGKRFGAEGAKEIFGADAAYTIDKLDEVLPGYLEKAEKVYFAMSRDERFNQKVFDLVSRCRLMRPRTGTGPTSLIDPGAIVHEMRLFKAEEEIALMRQAIAAAATAHLEAMQKTRAGMREYEIEALLEFTFRRLGAEGPAYPSIVAAGANAAVLHYISNNCQLQNGDLLLIDAGAEYGAYCADITRTFPIAANFSSPQREVYELVLQAQKEGIAMVQPGVRLDDVHRRVVEILTQGMIDLGIVQGDPQEVGEKEEYRRFYMHRTSHWLGMDVHDVGQYKVDGASRVLEPGMVFTVEPGLYIAEDSEGVDPRFRGLGVRIEDDLLVTPTGHEVLSAAVPKEISDLESLRWGT